MYSYGGSIFPGVHIVVNDTIPKYKYERLRKSYSDLGFATTKVVYSSPDAIDELLYLKFFRPDNAKRRLLRQYNSYVDRVMLPYVKKDHTPCEYSYVEVDFDYEEYTSFDGNSTVTAIDNETNLIQRLNNMIREPGPKLIIVEAPAGFGKTSTSYELLRFLCSQEDNKRPFFMELAKDRQAGTFRYLLLSQIEQDFEIQIRNEVVIDNIRNGRIPLIIDGFDELLSEDIDRGEYIEKNDKVETMLSTIGNLLTEESKIVLTSQKTAIFSGQKFIDWFETRINEGNIFTVNRFLLHEPTVRDWLSEEQLSKLPANITKVANPVLLTFLRYSDLGKIEQFQTPGTLVNEFFRQMFDREKKRQELPLSSDEQSRVFENLAAFFAEYGITAGSRADISMAISEYNTPVIEKYETSVLDYKSLVNKLTNHALLDRKRDDKLGFINEFIFGAMLGRALMEIPGAADSIGSVSDDIADKMLESVSIWDEPMRKKLAAILDKMPEESPYVRFGTDACLRKDVASSYSGLIIERMQFDTVQFGKSGKLENCVFSACDFSKCTIDFKNLSGCSFLDCGFEETAFYGNNQDNVFVGSTIPEECGYEHEEYVEHVEDSDLTPITEAILGKFYRVGSRNTRIRTISGIIDELSGQYGRKTVEKSIKKAISKRYIHAKGDKAWILNAGSDRYQEFHRSIE